MTEAYPLPRREPHRASRIEVATDGRERAFAAARRHSASVRVLKIAIPAALLVGVGGYAATTMLAPAALPVTFDTVELSPDALVMQEPRMEGEQGNGERYAIQSDRAIQRTDNPDLVELETVDAAFGMGAQGEARVTAERGVYDTVAGLLNLSGGLTFVTAAGVEARLQSADIAMAGGNIRSSEPVEIVSGSQVITGNQLEMTEGGARMLLTGGVSLKTNSPDGGAPAPQPAGDGGGSLFGGFSSEEGPFEITADSLEQATVDGQSVLTFTGNVVAARGSMVLRAPLMVVEAPASEGGAGAVAADFQQIEASGGVTIESGGRTVTGETASIDLEAGINVMTGNVVLIDGESRLSGYRMVANMETGNLEVEGRSGTRVRFFTPGDPNARPSSGGFLGGFESSAGPTEVVSDHFQQTSSGSATMLEFRGTVVANRDGAIIRSGVLTITAPGGSEGDPFATSEFERLDATGGVTFESDGQVATGTALVVNMVAGTILMTGNGPGTVTLSNGSDRLMGDRLMVEDGRVSLEPLRGATITPRNQ